MLVLNVQEIMEVLPHRYPFLLVDRIEAMAQVGGAYVAAKDSGHQDRVTYFVGIDKARFRKPVVPGDQLRMELELVSKRRGIYQFMGKAFVGETLVAEAELKATFVEK